MEGEKAELKQRVCDVIDSHREEIIEIGEAVWRKPELGYKEVATARLVVGVFGNLGLEYEEGVGVTGVIARVPGRSARPNIAVMGELDALAIPEHPEADPATGAVHACGHHAQVANLLGVAYGIIGSELMSELDGSVTLMAVPSEEPLDIEWRQTMREQGRLEFLGGKQEFIRLGAFDDVDISLIGHLDCGPERQVSIEVRDTPGPGMDGFIAKLVRYQGVETHAGLTPELGTNALNAAILGLSAIDAQRETFRGHDSIRVHYIITKGGDSVNVTPADVRIEMMIRGATPEAIKDASMKVDRALRSGAIAVGADVGITNIPGYLPTGGSGTSELSRVLRDNMISLVGSEAVPEGDAEPARVCVPSGGVSDGNDVASIVPTAGMVITAAEGTLHGRDYKTVDSNLAYVVPAKAYAMTIVDLLYGGAALAKRVIENYKPAVAKDAYLQHWRDIMSES